MKKYNVKAVEGTEDVQLEDKDFLLITAIDNLSNEIRLARLNNGR
jgi:hypothetical protein